MDRGVVLSAAETAKFPYGAAVYDVSGLEAQWTFGLLFDPVSTLFAIELTEELDALEDAMKALAEAAVLVPLLSVQFARFVRFTGRTLGLG